MLPLPLPHRRRRPLLVCSGATINCCCSKAWCGSILRTWRARFWSRDCQLPWRCNKMEKRLPSHTDDHERRGWKETGASSATKAFGSDFMSFCQNRKLPTFTYEARGAPNGRFVVVGILGVCFVPLEPLPFQLDSVAWYIVVTRFKRCTRSLSCSE